MNSFTYLWRWNWQWVPKRRQLELRLRGITQKGTNYIKKNIARMYKIQNCYRCFTFLYKSILEFKRTSINVVFLQKQLHTWASCWYLTCSAPQSTKPIAVLMAHHIMFLSHTYIQYVHFINPWHPSRGVGIWNIVR